MRERISAKPDFAGASPNDRDLLTRTLLHFAVDAADSAEDDALLARVFAAFHAAKLGATEALDLFTLPQFSRLWGSADSWAQRATLADGGGAAPIDPAFVCAQLERAARLAGRLRAIKFQVDTVFSLISCPSPFECPSLI